MARVAFTARTAEVVLASAVVLATATDPHELTRIRRDYDRLRRHARAHAWTDDTPVPPDVSVTR